MEGMVTKYNVYSCNGYLTPSIYNKKHRPVRRMYIAAVDIDWDFVPRKLNTVTMTDLKDPKTCVKIVVVLPNCVLYTVKTQYGVFHSSYIGYGMKSVSGQSWS